MEIKMTKAQRSKFSALKKETRSLVRGTGFILNVPFSFFVSWDIGREPSVTRTSWYCDKAIGEMVMESKQYKNFKAKMGSIIKKTDALVEELNADGFHKDAKMVYNTIFVGNI
jgi:hypothetical protein